MLLLDTNIAILLRDGEPGAVADFLSRNEALAISLITVVELKGGLGVQPALRETRRAAIDHLLDRLVTLPMERRIADAYGLIVEHGSFSRRLVFDRLIAATAIVHDMTLVTANPDDFRNIPGLSLEIWPGQ